MLGLGDRKGMRVMVMGGSGMLGHKVFQVLDQRFETYATFRNPRGLWKDFPMYKGNSHALGEVDVFDFDSVVRAVKKVRPDVVVNCIGITKQRKEASNPITSITVNSLFPHRLSELCTRVDSRMIQISTDCVFSGRKGNYSEDDNADAEDIYGRTKYLGEVRGPGCLTIRTSVFGRDFLKQDGLLEWFLSNRGGKVRGYKNAIFTGLPTQVLARIIRDVISDHPRLHGLYHVAGEPISKYNLLVRIRDAMKLDIKVEPYGEVQYDRSLNAAQFIEATGYKIPSWQEMIIELAGDTTPYDEWRREHATS